MVLAQALAVGLPVVCTDRTGGSDLAHSPELARRIKVVPSDDIKSLGTEIERALAGNLRHRPLPEADRQLLSWQRYGRRYAAELERDLRSI